MQPTLAISAGAAWSLAFAVPFLLCALAALVTARREPAPVLEQPPGPRAPSPWLLLAPALVGVVLVATGDRFGPTAVPALDAVLTVVFVVLAALGVERVGTGPRFGALATPAAAGAFALLAFADQDTAAAIAAAVGALCLFSWVRAAVLGQAGLDLARSPIVRLGAGTVLAVLALVMDVGDDPWRELVSPPILLGLALLGGAYALSGALRRRAPAPPRLANREGGAAWLVLGLAGVVLAGLALLVGRAVLHPAAGAGIAATVVLVVAVVSPRTEPRPARDRRLRRIVRWSIVAIVAALAISLVSLALVARDATDAMQDGREEATTGLSTARDGDTPGALDNFERAADAFEDARGKLTVTRTAGGLAVPFVAGNVRAARDLADLGTDLTHAATRLARAANADELDVVDGRVPIETVRKLTPELESSAAAVTDALTRLDDLRDEPYLLAPVRRAGEPRLRRAPARGR